MIVKYKKSFLKDIKLIRDVKTKKQISNLIAEFKKAESITEIKNVKKLKGSSNYYRIRIGSYRLGFKLDVNEVILYRFLPRKEIYRKFP